jgi:ribose transport system permease protein
LARIGEVPVIVVVAVLVAVIVGLVLAFTRFGLYCYAVGSNQEGARRVGVPTARTLVAAFVMMGSLSGIAGVLDLARFSAVSVATHQYDNVTAIAAVIIGGASLYGGRGTVFGTAVGTLIPIVLLQGFVILNVNPSWQNVAIGTVLVAAVAIDHYERTSRRARAETLAAEGDVAAPIDPVNPTPSEGQPR